MNGADGTRDEVTEVDTTGDDAVFLTGFEEGCEQVGDGGTVKIQFTAGGDGAVLPDWGAYVGDAVNSEFDFSMVSVTFKRDGIAAECGHHGLEQRHPIRCVRQVSAIAHKKR